MNWTDRFICFAQCIGISLVDIVKVSQKQVFFPLTVTTYNIFSVSNRLDLNTTSLHLLCYWPSFILNNILHLAHKSSCETSLTPKDSIFTLFFSILKAKSYSAWKVNLVSCWMIVLPWSFIEEYIRSYFCMLECLKYGTIFFSTRRPWLYQKSWRYAGYFWITSFHVEKRIVISATLCFAIFCLHTA